MKKRASLLLLPLLATGALAQDTVLEEAEPEIRRYTVEMIIFAYAEGVSAGSEVFPPDVPLVHDIPLDDELGDELGDELDNSNTLKSVPEIVRLARKDFTLVESYRHLKRLDAYEPLMHFGWTQRTYPDEEVESRSLRSFMTPPDGLEGELTLYLSRYLHLAVKLQLDASFGDTALEGEAFSSRNSFDDGYYNLGDDTPVSYPVRYRIEEDRIFRNGEVRYFDHPKFGLLAKITRVEEEETVEGELLGDMELLGDTVE